MYNIQVGFLVVLWFCYNFNMNHAVRTNFEVKDIHTCNNTQGIIKLNANITKENNKQYLTFKIDSPVPWDNNLGLALIIFSKLGNQFYETFIIHENDFCKAMNKYLGEFWYDIGRASGITPKLCPVQAGRYQAHHMELNFNKISLQTFPFGRLRFVIKAINNKKPQVNMLCLFLEVENLDI